MSHAYFYPAILMRFIGLVAALCLLMASMNSAKAGGEFVLTDMRGQQHRLSGYQGKWVLVNYWATWCPPCLEEVPDLVMLYDQYKDQNLMVIGVAQEYKTSQEVAEFADDMMMSYPIVLGNKSVNDQIGPSEILPTTYIYNPQGKMVKIKRGLISRQYIEKLLTGKLPEG